MRITVRSTALLALLAAPIACGDSGTDTPVADFIQLTSEIDVLPAGQSWQLETEVRDEDGDIITDPDVDYETSSTSIATVNNQGVVTGVGDGIATITATADAVSDEVEIGIFDIGNLCENALGIGVGESVRASLQPGDCDEIVVDESFVDIWFFQLTQERTVTIDLESSAFDAYMWLLDGGGTDVAEDDDTGGGTDARIVETLPAGTYFILANHYLPDFGAYTLTVTASTTADPAGGGMVAGVRAERAIPAATIEKVRSVPEIRLQRR